MRLKVVENFCKPLAPCGREVGERGRTSGGARNTPLPRPLSRRGRGEETVLRPPLLIAPGAISYQAATAKRRTSISTPAFNTIEFITNFCYKKQEYQDPLNYDDFKYFINEAVVNFLQVYEISILKNKQLLNLYEYFKKLLNLVFDETVTLENLKVISNNFIYSMKNLKYKTENYENIIEEFIILSDKLPELWFDSRLLNEDEDEESYHYFTNAIFSFSDEIKFEAKKLKKYPLQSEKHCLNNLKEMILMKFEFLNFKVELLGLFKGFIESIYEKEFFSNFNKLTKTSNIQISESKISDTPVSDTPVNEDIKTCLDSIEKDLILNDPIGLIRNINELKESEIQESVNFLLETYSEFVDQNFKGPNSNLKILISTSIRETFK